MATSIYIKIGLDTNRVSLVVNGKVIGWKPLKNINDLLSITLSLIYDGIKVLEELHKKYVSEGRRFDAMLTAEAIDVLKKWIR